MLKSRASTRSVPERLKEALRLLSQNASVLTTKEGKPLTHMTEWDDISESGQAALLELEWVSPA